MTIVAATMLEIEPTRQYLDTHFHTTPNFVYEREGMTVQLLITGVGMTATAFALGQYLAHQPTDLVVNAGIAGAFNRDLTIGEVVLVENDRFGDVGVEEADGRFTDVHELELTPFNDYPFLNGWLPNPRTATAHFLKKATALTVNKVHGTTQSIAIIQSKYPADIESMEGAAVHFACLLADVPFFQIRSVSNYVEKRNRENWNIPLAITHLNQVLVEMIAGYSAS